MSLISICAELLMTLKRLNRNACRDIIVMEFLYLSGNEEVKLKPLYVSEWNAIKDIKRRWTSNNNTK